MEHGMNELWKDGAFIQDCVDPSREAEGLIRARIDGNWQNLTLNNLPEEFMEWNLRARLEMLEKVESMVTGQRGEAPSLAGPHNAAMATRGVRRNDSVLEINNAFKGMGLCPRRELIEEKIIHMKNTADSPMLEKISFLKEMYSDSGNFDTTKLISLELYSTPAFETHTFLNLISEPVTSLVFLDTRSYEVRGIGQLISPGEPGAEDYSLQIVEYTNLAHSYFHGDFPRLFPGILVHVIETFDNTPGSGRGVLLE